MTDIIYAMGDDAFSNAFDLQFGFINLPGISDLSSLAIRVQNVSIPGYDIEEYEVSYKTVYIMKPNGKIKDPKEFSCSIRMDRNWLIYKALLTWQKQIHNTDTGQVNPDTVSENSRMDFVTIAPSNPGIDVSLPEGIGNWKMLGVYPKSIPEISFDYTSGDAISVR